MNKGIIYALLATLVANFTVYCAFFGTNDDLATAAKFLIMVAVFVIALTAAFAVAHRVHRLLDG